LRLKAAQEVAGGLSVPPPYPRTKTAALSRLRGPGSLMPLGFVNHVGEAPARCASDPMRSSGPPHGLKKQRIGVPRQDAASGIPYKICMLWPLVAPRAFQIPEPTNNAYD
jgi:hypothetical protein